MASPWRDCIGRCYTVVAICFVVGIIIGIPAILIHGFIMVHGVSVSVEDATLSTFAVTTPSPTTSTPPAPTTAGAAAVTYNISMTLRVHNSNWFQGVVFAAPLKARYSFDGALFGPDVWLAGKGDMLHAGKTWVYSLTTGAVGQRVPGLGAHGVADFAWQRSAGVFEVQPCGDLRTQAATWRTVGIVVQEGEVCVGQEGLMLV